MEEEVMGWGDGDALWWDLLLCGVVCTGVEDLEHAESYHGWWIEWATISLREPGDERVERSEECSGLRTYFRPRSGF